MGGAGFFTRIIASVLGIQLKKSFPLRFYILKIDDYASNFLCSIHNV